MQSPKISVVIPSYNKVKYIKKTLDSILNQSYKNYEVIIQDGGSNDGTLEVIKSYAKKYPKVISYVSKKDNGQLDAINKGIKKAKGEIVTFINADDFYEQGAFDSVVGGYVENPEALWLVGKCRIVNEKNEEIAKFWTLCKNTLLHLNRYFLLLLTSNYISQPSTFIAKKAFKKYGPFVGNKKFVYEYDLWLTLGKVKMPTIINKYISNFRISSDNKSSVMYDDLFRFDMMVVKKHSNNNFFVLLSHLLNNKLRILVRNLF